MGEVSHTMKQSAWQATSYVSIGDRGGGGGESPTWSVTSSSGLEDNAMLVCILLVYMMILLFS